MRSPSVSNSGKQSIGLDVTGSGTSSKPVAPAQPPDTAVSGARTEAHSEVKASGAGRLDSLRPSQTLGRLGLEQGPGAPVPESQVEVLAKVQDKAITNIDIARAVDTLEHRAVMGSLFRSFAKTLNITQGADEKEDAFEQRVAREALKQGKLQGLIDLVGRSLDAAALDALSDLTTLAVMDRLLKNLGRPVEQSEHDEADALALRLATRRVELEAAMLEKLASKVKTTDIHTALDAVIDRQFEDALWAPHAKAVDAFFPEWTPEDRLAARAALTTVYMGAHDLLAPHKIAEDLEAGGPAAVLAHVMKLTGTVELLASDLEACARLEPGTQPLVDALRAAGISDFLVEGLAPVSFTLKDGHLSATLKTPVSPSTAMSRLRAGELRAVTVGEGTSARLGLIEPKTGKLVEDQDVAVATRALEGRFSVAAKELERALGSGQPKVEDLPQLKALAPFLKDEEVALFLSSAKCSAALEAQAVAAAADSKGPIQLKARLRQIGVPESIVRRTVDTSLRAGLLLELHPLPPSLQSVLQGPDDRAFEFPLEPNAALSREASQALAHAQRMLVLNGLLPPTTPFGHMDARTVEELKGLSPEGSTSFRLDRFALRTMLATTARLADVDDELLGGMLLRHPVYLLHRKRGGLQHPVDLMLGYLRQKGVTLSPTSDQFVAKFAEALHYAAKAPVDRAALRKAEKELGHHPQPNSETRNAVLGARVLVSKRPLAFYSPGVEADPLAQERTLSRLTPYALPSAIRSLTPSINPVKRGLSDLTLYDPTVALKLLLSRIKDARPPVNADGFIDRQLTERDLCDLRDFRFSYALDGVKPPEFERWSRVAEYVRDGKVVLADLAHDVSPRPELSKEMVEDVNFVLEELRKVVAAVRSNSAPYVKPEAAVRRHTRRFDPLLSFAEPLTKAKEILLDGAEPSREEKRHRGLTTPDFTRLKQLHARVLERYQKRIAAGEADRSSVVSAAKRFLDRWTLEEKNLGEVLRAIHEGKLQIREGAARTQPRNVDLELAGERIKALFIEGAEVLQTERREADRGGIARFERAAISAAHHLFFLPNFGDDGVLFNAFDDWALLALKLDMKAQGLPGLEELDSASTALCQARSCGGANSIHGVDGATGAAGNGIAALAGPASSPAAMMDPATALMARKKASELSNVGPDVIRYVLKNYADFVGRSPLQTLTSGVPSRLPAGAEARKLLDRVASEMEAKHIEPWISVNVTSQRPTIQRGSSLTEDEINQAKLIFQATLRDIPPNKNVFRSVMPGRDLASARDLVTRLVGLDGPELAPFLKAFAVQQGLVGAGEIGKVRDTRISGKLLAGAADLAERSASSYEKDAPEVSWELKRAAALLKDAAARGKVVDLGGPVVTSTEGRALRTVIYHAVMSLGSMHQMDYLDFDEILAHAPKNLRVQGPLENLVASKPLFASFDSLLASAGKRVAWRDTGWAERAKNFDPDRGWQTAISSFTLFAYMMHTLIMYDMFISPVVQSAKALVSSAVAETKLEREDAHAKLEETWRRWLDLNAMFTAFNTPAGFGLDIGYELQRGNVDVALGKSVAFASFIYGTMMAMPSLAHNLLHGARQVRTMRDPYAFRGASVSAVESLRREAGASPTAARRGVARAVQAVGAAKDLVLDPSPVVKEPMAGLRTLAERSGLLRPIRYEAGKAGAKLSETELRWIWRQAKAGRDVGIEMLLAQPGGGTRTVVVQARDLVELTKHAPGQIPAHIARRIKLRGLHTQTLTEAASPIVEQLRNLEVKAEQKLVSLAELARDGGGTTQWRVSQPGSKAVLSVRNSELLQAVRAFYSLDSTLIERLQVLDTLPKKEADELLGFFMEKLPQSLQAHVQDLVKIALKYGQVPLWKIKAFEREAKVLDAAFSLRALAASKGQLLRYCAAAAAVGIPAYVAVRAASAALKRKKQEKANPKPATAKKSKKDGRALRSPANPKKGNVDKPGVDQAAMNKPATGKVGRAAAPVTRRESSSLGPVSDPLEHQPA